jgi:hypothetical protein
MIACNASVSLILFPSLMCLGQLLVAIGGTVTSYKLVLTGRIITSYGLLANIDWAGIMYQVTLHTSE